MSLWERYPEIEKELSVLEDYIIEHTSSRNRLLSKVVEDLVHAGGKRLRPAFAIISAKFGNYDREKLLPVAGAIEILHTATLVHDDIVDRSELRRGEPTVSEKYGLDMAVYTGDFLLTRAVLMLSGNASTDKLEYIARSVKTICEGEVDQYLERFDLNTSVRKYLKRISRKTAILFGAACLIGAESSGCSREVTRLLARFGGCYGMAFQMKDDLIDFLSNSKTAGKPVGRDILKGNITLPAIYAMGRNKEIRELFRKVNQPGQTLPVEDIRQFYDLVREGGGIEETRSLLKRYTEKSEKALTLLKDNHYRAILMELIENLQI